ncbi:MAG: 5-(carboxyamino)imidazole ribonucleotide mutase [Candidatus Bathyarchaeia archaeon]
MSGKVNQVSIVLGSESDRPVALRAKEVLSALKIPHEERVLSAHRNPKELEAYVEATPSRIFIAIAGLSAQLPGFIASITDRPVIGVPVSTKLGGLDSLLSIVQMPKGVPVASVGIDSAANAALFAARILALSDDGIRMRLEEWAIRTRERV